MNKRNCILKTTDGCLNTQNSKKIWRLCVSVITDDCVMCGFCGHVFTTKTRLLPFNERDIQIKISPRQWRMIILNIIRSQSLIPCWKPNNNPLLTEFSHFQIAYYNSQHLHTILSPSSTDSGVTVQFGRVTEAASPAAVQCSGTGLLDCAGRLYRSASAEESEWSLEAKLHSSQCLVLNERWVELYWGLSRSKTMWKLSQYWAYSSIAKYIFLASVFRIAK